jgi:hypothetical protein
MVCLNTIPRSRRAASLARLPRNVPAPRDFGAGIAAWQFSVGADSCRGYREGQSWRSSSIPGVDTTFPVTGTGQLA